MDDVKIERDGEVTIITIDRPHRRNAINFATAEALREAWLAFDADDTQKIGILTGGDVVFCAGADLKEIESLDYHSDDGALGFTYLHVSKPTIAAIAGYAVAGGLEVACWCDLRVVDETAIFGCYERRFGVPLINGGTQRLPQIIGLGRAMDMILTGRSVDAAEAMTVGLVTQVVPQSLHLDRAVELAHQLARFPQLCMKNDRAAVYGGLGASVVDGLKLEQTLGLDTMASGEAYQGAQRFADGKGRSGHFE